MPRYVVNESEDDYEPTTGRKTRAALAATTTDSPIRRSTRIRHSSVNPDGSSPESVTEVGANQVTTRVTRRRALTATGNTANAPQPIRALRSRKNSTSSNVSENLETESAPNTPRTRSIRRLSMVEPSPGTPKAGAKTRGSGRASSETKSSPPVVRTTRRTRAMSIDPEPTVERVATPTKKRRQQISVSPSEPAVAEEATEDKTRSKIDKVVEIPELEIDNEDSPEKSLLESSDRSSPASAKKLSKNESANEHIDVEIKDNESLTEKLPDKSLTPKLSSLVDKFSNEAEEEAELLKTPVEEILKNDVPAAMDSELQESPMVSQSLVIKTKRNSIDKSKELGMKIENLLNKSTEEQETSPGNKENQKLNVVTSDKVKKNIEFTVSNVNVSRGKSLGSIFVNKFNEKKIDTSLDERVLSRSRYDNLAAKSIQVDVNKPGKKSQAESTGDLNSPKKNGVEEILAAENVKELSGYTKIDETVVENEVIEEFTLYDSNDDSRSDFSLTVEDNDEIDKITSFSNVVPEDSNFGNVSKQGSSNKGKKNSEVRSEGKVNLDSDSDIFEVPNPSKINSRENSNEIILQNKEDIPKKRFSLNSRETENQSEANKSPNKLDVKTKTIEDKETDNLIAGTSFFGDGETSSFEIEAHANGNIDEEEPMDTNEHEEIKADVNSPEKQSSDREGESLKAKESKSKSNEQVSDSDSTTAIDSLFHNISAEEWNKKQKSPKKKLGEEKTGDQEESDSDNTVILEKADSPKKTNKNKRSSYGKKIVKETESEESETEVIAKTKESPKKSKKLNTSMENTTDHQMPIETNKTDSTATSLEQDVGIDDNSSEAETIPTKEDHSPVLQDDNSENEETEEDEKGKQSSSAKKTPENRKNKSPVKSGKKSTDGYKFEDPSSDTEEDKKFEESSDEEERTRILTPRTKSLRKKERGSILDQLRTPLGRNYSVVAVADSDSGPDMPSSDNSEHSVPGYLFNAESSGDEKESSNMERDESNDTINSDIAKELNLAGDTDVKYSDDDVPGDECRASESEHSDETDEASDMADFIVDDDKVESSEYSDEESESEFKYKRILNKSSSEEEEEEAEETEKENAEGMELKYLTKKLSFSFDSDKTLSTEKMKKEKTVPDVGEPKVSSSPEISDIEKSKLKLKKFSKPMIKSLLNSTIDLCTPPVKDAPTQDGDKSVDDSPGLDTSTKNKSLKKLKKRLIEDIEFSTPKGNDSMEQNETVEPMFTQKTKTPNKEKKTPKSAKKSKRNSIEQMTEIATLESELTQEDEEEESVSIAKAKTLSKEKRTPKSARKNQRDSMQEIKEISNLESDSTEEDEKEELISISKTKRPNKEKKTPKSARNSQNISIQKMKNIATPESELEQDEEAEEELVSVPKTKTPNREKKTPKSARKNQRDSIQEIKEISNLESDSTEEDEKEELISISKTKTPNKEKKTPKSARKNQRDSIQLIEEAASIPSQVSDLNKSMQTPNSESPVTKFLKKERLNESLPLLELKKRTSRSLDKKTLKKMTEVQQEVDEEASDTEQHKRIAEESEGEESDANDDLEENNDEFNANGHNDENEEDETDEDQKEEENIDAEENEDEPEDEESEESEESSKEEVIIQKEAKKSGGRKKSLTGLEEPIFSKNATPKEKKLTKKQSIRSASTSVNEKSTELINGKKRARLESSDTPQGLKRTKKMKITEVKKSLATLEAESDSDDAPETLGFVEARTGALQQMKEVAASLKAAKEAKKKKRRDQLERIHHEKEAKAAKKLKPETGKTNLKRLPEDLLENLSDVAQRPQKKRKLLKKEEQILPSRFMFSPEKQLRNSLKIEESNSSLSTGGGTTHFSVVNLDKVKKKPKKAAEVASFRERMLARNPRQPVSAFLMYQAKQKAAGKHLGARKQA